MEIIGGAALIAVAVVLAAVIYGRTHRPATPASNDAASASDLDRQLSERGADLARREESLVRREAGLEQEREQLAATRRELERVLEQASGMSAARAKQLLLSEIEGQAKHDAARRIRQIEEETKREADRRVRNILSVCMQRLAAGHATETTVSVVHLTTDD
ncbi:MAG TPA: Rnase Y domain-containing protein, partial [Solirubrobacteraceae bacterium]